MKYKADRLSNVAAPAKRKSIFLFQGLLLDVEGLKIHIQSL